MKGDTTLEAPIGVKITHTLSRRAIISFSLYGAIASSVFNPMFTTPKSKLIEK